MDSRASILGPDVSPGSVCGLGVHFAWIVLSCDIPAYEQERRHPINIDVSTLIAD